MNLDPVIVRRIQTRLRLSPDGILGPQTLAAIDAALSDVDADLRHVGPLHVVLASSFADPADIAAFRKCKATGKTDEQCFAVGDNGVGKWGNSTAQGTGPCCALPPEDWQHLANPGRARVLVSANGRSVLCDLRDTMPKKANIKNGAGIDLNPDACDLLGLTPPILARATWQWVE